MIFARIIATVSVTILGTTEQSLELLDTALGIE